MVNEVNLILIPVNTENIYMDIESLV